jgi:SAM-dependent methyltransferase
VIDDKWPLIVKPEDVMLRLSGRGGLKWRLLPLVRLAFAMVGRRWAYFYSWMLNRQDRKLTIDHVLRRSRALDSSEAPSVKGLYDIAVGQRYVDFLKVEGLRPSHRTLDFGCGYGRIGIPMLRYLDPGCYVGVDLSRERIRLAREYVVHEKLEDKRPEFFEGPPNNDLSYLSPRSFDVIWVHSVFAHMPLADVQFLLPRLARLLKPDGMLIANYSFADRQKKTNLSAFWFPEEDVRKAVSRAGLVYGETSDYWITHIAPERGPTDKMIKLRLSAATANHHA